MEGIHGLARDFQAIDVEMSALWRDLACAPANDPDFQFLVVRDRDLVNIDLVGVPIGLQFSIREVGCEVVMAASNGVVEGPNRRQPPRRRSVATAGWVRLSGFVA